MLRRRLLSRGALRVSRTNWWVASSSRPLTAQATPPSAAAASSASPNAQVMDFDTREDWLKGDYKRANAERFADSHRKLVETLSHIPKKALEFQTRARDDLDDESSQRDAMAAASRSGLFYRQLKIEEEQMADAAQNYAEALKNIMELGKGSGLKFVQRIALKWYEPLNAAIEHEKKQILKKQPAADRTQYGPVMLLLSTEKLAVITLNTTLNMILRTGNMGVGLSDVAKTIGELVETEVNVSKLQLGNKKLPLWQQDIINDAYTERKYRRTLAIKIRNLLYDDAWSMQIKLKLGAALVKVLVDCTKNENGVPIFQHTTYFYASIQRRMGQLVLEQDVFRKIAEKDMDHVLPRYLPMLVPPKEWNNKLRAGCYYRLRTSIMRTQSPSHIDALQRADMGPILDGLNYLGQIPWRVNRPVLHIVKEALERGMVIGELPPNVNVPLPLETECYRVPAKLTVNRISKKHLAAQAKTNKKGQLPAGSIVEGVAMPLELQVDDTPLAAPEAAGEGSELDVAATPEVPGVPVFDANLYKEMCRRVKLKNAEMHSLRCDIQLKVWVAEKFEEDCIYFPHNLDFRGRAYPVPQNLSHLGSDVCRGLLTFDEAKPLGPVGFDWLKVHLANLFGHNKITLRQRVQWVDAHMEQVIDSAKRPLDGLRWWATAEEPFQALAAILEIVAASESGDPAAYLCSLPIHQDGSCNGLQHYAALGRDEAGAIAVNLMPNRSPQDVYSTVLDIVLAKIKVDMETDPEEVDTSLRERGRYARLVYGVVNRKVVKQTVMTSVYGVTRIGARAQIQARLEEKLTTDRATIKSPEADRDIFEASRCDFAGSLCIPSLVLVCTLLFPQSYLTLPPLSTSLSLPLSTPLLPDMWPT